MNHLEFIQSVESQLQNEYPSLKSRELSWSLANLVSPQIIPLSSALFQQISQSIQALFEVSRTQSYQTKIPWEDSDLKKFTTDQYSVLMAYDFHIDQENETAHLIEVNTNASGFLLAHLLYEIDPQINNPIENPLEKLKASFFREAQLDQSPTKKVAIIDEDLESQKMLIEFYLYQELLQRWGWDVDMLDIKNARIHPLSKKITNQEGKEYDFIYNRFCDFYLREGRSQALRKSYLNKATLFSPHPKEYSLLADKQRMVELSQPGWLEAVEADSAKTNDIRKILIPTFDRHHFSSEEEIWNQRKSLFFKPKQAFGGKATYRGSSISRRAFHQLLEQDPLIQKYIPAPSVDPLTEAKDRPRLKYDLRVFAYGPQIQLVAARLYEGQVTNFSSELGGFARVQLEP